MARRITWGTPGRSKHYVLPRRAFTLLLPSAATGFGLAVALVLLHAAGKRTPVAPGDVISGHALLEARCEECHAPRQGASSLRCQRCHDPAGAGRLTSASHVLFGSGDSKKAAAAPNMRCADCHVEHRGRLARLATVDEATCRECHFKSLAAHPEFAVLRSPSREVPGIKFGHERHVQEAVKRSGLPPGSTCVQCHEPAPASRDFETLSFDRHCASCHVKQGSIGTMDPVSAEDLVPPEEVLSRSASDAATPRAEEFETSRGRISRNAVHHKDAWILACLRKLRREVDPDGYAAERGALLARISQLQRRMALSAPLAGMDAAALAARESALKSEVQGVEGRIQAARTSGGDPASGLARLDEVFSAAAASGDAAALAEAQGLRQRAAALRSSGAPAAALPADDFDARRRELLGLLDAVEGADPALKGRAEDLRRRLAALAPGEAGIDVLSRVRDQRLADLERVADERLLRGAGVSAPVAVLMVARQRAIQKALADTQAELNRLSEGPAPKAPLTPEERERKLASVDALTTPCVKCHVIVGAKISHVVAARSVLRRAAFVHRPHLLQVDCARCHANVDKSKLSSDLNLPGIASCRQCHRERVARADCEACHRYHPAELP